ncbi:hypothetical protein BC628DRAFT_1398868 [Trametes gibbosa]|nr:hypothetical protein BC628DRAFT_1398868 [Trametes gibbosa]
MPKPPPWLRFTPQHPLWTGHLVTLMGYSKQLLSSQQAVPVLSEQHTEVHIGVSKKCCACCNLFCAHLLRNMPPIENMRGKLLAHLIHVTRTMKIGLTPTHSSPAFVTSSLDPYRDLVDDGLSAEAYAFAFICVLSLTLYDPACWRRSSVSRKSKMMKMTLAACSRAWSVFSVCHGQYDSRLCMSSCLLPCRLSLRLRASFYLLQIDIHAGQLQATVNVVVAGSEQR